MKNESTLNKKRVSLLCETSKNFKVIFLSVLLFFTVLIVVIPLSLMNNNKNRNTGFRVMDIYELYSIGRTSFSNVEILEIDSSLYYCKYNENTKYIIVKCEVIEDFYKEFNKGTRINIPFCVSNLEDLSVEIDQIKEWFYSMDSLCIYMSISYLSDKISNSGIYINEKTEVPLINEINIGELSLFSDDYIPIIKEKVDFDTKNKLFNTGYPYEYRTKYREYIKNDMEENVLFENLRKLYIEQLERCK